MAKLKGRESYPFYFGAPVELLTRAGELRRSMTPAEKILWKRLHDRKLEGFRFRRQHPIHTFIVDFFCYEAMLVVEVDGEIHIEKTRSEYDEERTILLKKFGIQVVRFRNEEIENQIDLVCEKILLHIKNRHYQNSNDY